MATGIANFWASEVILGLGLHSTMNTATRNRPGIDGLISPSAGVTSNGQPLSYNRAPAPDLAPWIARLYVTAVVAPEDHLLSCGLFNDTAFIRLQIKGDWIGQTADGQLEHGRAALFFGPQSKRMPISVTGSFTSIGISFRPGACRVLGGPNIADYLDRIVTMEAFGQDSEHLLGLIDPKADPETWLQVLEDEIRKWVKAGRSVKPDAITAAFEAVAFANPNVSISEFASEHGIEQRRLARLIARDFGLPPKQVLRRARALDMASHLRGVADADEGDELQLRYYDQSHLIHEFVELFGISPRHFVDSAQPIMTLALESRQARRLEAMQRLAPGARRPWETEPATSESVRLTS